MIHLGFNFFVPVSDGLWVLTDGERCDVVAAALAGHTHGPQALLDTQTEKWRVSQGLNALVSSGLLIHVIDQHVPENALHVFPAAASVVTRPHSSASTAEPSTVMNTYANAEGRKARCEQQRHARRPCAGRWAG